MKNKAPRKKPAVNRVYYIYVGILAVLFFTFHTIPFLKGVMYSFTDWRGYGEWNFVGLRNYIHMFSDVDTGNAYLFTFKFAVITTLLVNVISLILACALNAKIKFKNTIKAFYFLPYMLGSLIVGFIFNYIFANLIPQLGKGLGIKALSVNILGTNHAIWGIVAVSLWIGCAFNTLIYIAGLQSIDTDVYEAADLDGATGFKKIQQNHVPSAGTIFYHQYGTFRKGLSDGLRSDHGYDRRRSGNQYNIYCSIDLQKRLRRRTVRLSVSQCSYAFCGSGTDFRIPAACT